MTKISIRSKIYIILLITNKFGKKYIFHKLFERYFFRFYNIYFFLGNSRTAIGDEYFGFFLHSCRHYFSIPLNYSGSRQQHHRSRWFGFGSSSNNFSSWRSHAHSHVSQRPESTIYLGQVRRSRLLDSKRNATAFRIRLVPFQFRNLNYSVNNGLLFCLL